MYTPIYTQGCMNTCVCAYIHMYVHKTTGYHINKVLPKSSHSFRLNSQYQELPEERKIIADPEI